MDRRKRKKFLERNARKPTNKTVSRLSYNPLTDKKKFTSKLRSDLQAKLIPPIHAPVPTTTIEIGAININGLNVESAWALEQIVEKYHLKVKLVLLTIHLKIKFLC
jgi:hypothetical protein